MNVVDDLVIWYWLNWLTINVFFASAVLWYAILNKKLLDMQLIDAIELSDITTHEAYTLRS